MKIQLSTGKTVDIPDEMYFSMSDEEYLDEIQFLVAFDYGDEYNDPFYDSNVKNPPADKSVEDSTLLEITSFDKFKSLSDLETDSD
jgi:hypothetical protein